MLYSSLAILALSASAAASPISGLFHLHAHMAMPSTRVELSLYNSSNMFRDVSIDGQSYTIGAHHSLTVAAKPGTLVVSDSNMGAHKRGEVLVDIEPKLKGQRIDIQ
jgi:hypothetical protein